MNGIPYFEIQADNVPEVANFYSEVFGWKIAKNSNMPIEYWQIDAGGSRGAVLKRPCKTPPMEYGTNAFTCSFEVENFDAAAKTIAQLGGKIAMDKFAVPGKCWQGYFIDPDNNVFGIFEVDVNAK